MDDRSLARWRMHTQRLAGPPYPSPTGVVEGLLAVQAENHSQASWAVATRTGGMKKTEFDRLFDEGAILRTHVLRPTWHYVRPDDIRWLLELTAPRVVPVFTNQQRELGLEEHVTEKSMEVMADSLGGGVHLTRGALGERLGEAGLPDQGRALAMVLGRAEMAGLICSGSMQGHHHTYALLDDRAPHGRRLDRDEAIPELVLRYFSGHGPATELDLTYWATMTLTDVRDGLLAVSDQLDHFEHDGRTYWFVHPPPDDQPLVPSCHLLQILDEYYRGYQDSRYVLDADGIVPRGREANAGMVLIDGQMVGGMRRKVTARQVVFEVDLYREIDDRERTALDVAGERYGNFLDLRSTVVVG